MFKLIQSRWCFIIGLGSLLFSIPLAFATEAGTSGPQVKQPQAVQKNTKIEQSAQAQQPAAKEEQRTPAGTTTYGNQVEDVEELLDNLPQFTNQKVTIPGEVQDKAPRSFVLESGGWIENEILVIPSNQVNMDLFAQLAEDNNVTVIGTVRTAGVSEIETELGVEFDPILRGELGQARAYILAEQIVPQPD